VIATHKAIIPAAVGVDIGCGIVACRLSITGNDLDEKSLRKVFGQISRDVPVGRAQHQDDRALVDAAKPFEPRLDAMTHKHPQLLKAFGKDIDTVMANQADLVDAMHTLKQVVCVKG